MLKMLLSVVLGARRRHWALTRHRRLTGHWVLTRHRRVTASPAFTTVTRIILRVVNLAPMRRLDRFAHTFEEEKSDA